MTQESMIQLVFLNKLMVQLLLCVKRGNKGKQSAES